MPMGFFRNLPQFGFKNFSSPDISKFTGGSPYAGLTAERQGLRLQGLEAQGSNEANKTGMKKLSSKGY
jgi:hypothetical protein